MFTLPKFASCPPVFLCLLCAAAALPLRAVDLRVDLNEQTTANNTTVNTEGGFQVMTLPASVALNAATTLSTTAAFGSQSVTIAPAGSIAAPTWSARKRAAPVNNTVTPATFNQQALLQDFIFGLYSATNTTAGMDITISGLTAGKEYAITLWSFDASSSGTRVSDWSANGQPKVDNYTFDGRVPPTTNEQYQIYFTAIADGTGTILIQGRRDSTSFDAQATPQPSHGVFLNGLWIRDLFVDTDGDLMPDGWEDANNLDKLVNDAGDDPDDDESDNLAEYNAGTNPHDSDSDDDGLLDGYENKSGTFVSTINTGTNPLNADTDGDGLGDAIENPLLPWLSPAQPGTDPNKYDSDGDAIGDGTEVNWPTHPRNNTVFPFSSDITLAVDAENTAAVAQPGFQPLLGATDAAAATLLTANFGAHTVTITSVGATTLRSRDRAAAAGGGDFNPLYRDFIYADNSDLDGEGLDVTITGLTPLTWYPVTLWSWDPTSAASARHSTWLASDGDNPPAVKVPLYALTGATPLPVNPRTDRRLKFDALSNSAGELVIQGRKEPGFTAATINVFLNGFIIGPPVTPLQFTSIAGPQLTFTSDDIGVYEVLGSPDLQSWSLLAPAVDGQPGTTAWTDPGPDPPRRFYQVRRVSP